jgi:hypothetical protein
LARSPVHLDYLQIFQLEEVIGGTTNTVLQQIVHVQEEPSYRFEITVPIHSPIKEKVYVVDEGNYATMMMAEDY